jgi:uncharacterized protein involved in exopolysaccharide biosynthesis
MQRYLAAGRRYKWLILAILMLLWGAGAAAAYHEYTSTFESQAIIWVLRPSPELTAINPEDPGIPIIQTVATQQAELLDQLLRTNSFVRDVVERTSQITALRAASDETRYLDEIRKHFKVEPLGTNMLRVSFTAANPHTPAEMVSAALAVRADRVIQARVASSAAVNTVYRKEFEVAQTQALDAQRELDDFDRTQTGTLSPADQGHRAQLQLALDFAQSRINELRGRADRAAVAAAVLEMSGLEFQVVDEPREEPRPSGGTKSAAVLAVVAIGSGILLAALLIFVGGQLANHVAGPADIGRLAPATLFATMPRVLSPGHDERGLRRSLAAIAFADEGRVPRGSEL